eukprot:748319-Hanusia_phi.AAC.9
MKSGGGRRRDLQLLPWHRTGVAVGPGRTFDRSCLGGDRLRRKRSGADEPSIEVFCSLFRGYGDAFVSEGSPDAVMQGVNFLGGAVCRRKRQGLGLRGQQDLAVVPCHGMQDMHEIRRDARVLLPPLHVAMLSPIGVKEAGLDLLDRPLGLHRQALPRASLSSRTRPPSLASSHRHRPPARPYRQRPRRACEEGNCLEDHAEKPATS